ncbi:MAG: DUF4142 domain-containing protein [Tepidisphaeraceae bacterium]
MKLNVIVAIGLLAAVGCQSNHADQDSSAAQRLQQRQKMQNSSNVDMAGYTQPVLTASEKDFIDHVLSQIRFELQSGKLAVNNAGSDAVKGFAQQMVADYMRENDELTALAGTKGYAPSIMIMPRYRGMVEQLATMRGPQFDKQYLLDQTDVQESILAEFTRAADFVADKDLKAFIEKTIPAMQKQNEMLKALAPTIVAP